MGLFGATLLSARGAAAFAASDRAKSEPAIWTPLHLAQNRVIQVPVTVNGRTVSGMIDSGTSRSIISQALAADLGLVSMGPTSATSFTDRIWGSTYRIDRLELAGLGLSTVELESYDIAQIENLARHRIPVLLGRDVLQRVDVDVDFVGDQVRCLPFQGVHEGSGQTVPLVGSGAGFPSIPLLLEGQSTQACLLDLGSDVPVSMAADYARSRGYLDDRKTSTGLMLGAEGLIRNQTFSLKSIVVGGFVRREIPVQVIDEWKLAEPISVGWPLLDAFSAVLSLGGKVLQLKADQNALAAGFPKDRLGMFGQRQSDRLIVLHVASGSPAWLVGLRADDVVTSIDGRPVTENYPSPGKKIGFQPAGTTVNLGLADSRNLQVELADYF